MIKGRDLTKGGENQAVRRKSKALERQEQIPFVQLTFHATVTYVDKWIVSIGFNEAC